MTIPLLAAVFSVLAAPHYPTAACKEASPGLQARVKISCRAARTKALRSAGGKGLRVVSAELEEEAGRLVYSFDIARKRQTGVEEVQIDARSGEVVSMKHESAKEEAAEAK